jgi:hypothetical protein
MHRLPDDDLIKIEACWSVFKCFNDDILKEYIIIYKCALVGIYYLVYRFAFAESNVDRKWDRVIFTDESTFSSANDGPVLV